MKNIMIEKLVVLYLTLFIFSSKKYIFLIYKNKKSKFWKLIVKTNHKLLKTLIWKKYQKYVNKISLINYMQNLFHLDSKSRKLWVIMFMENYLSQKFILEMFWVYIIVKKSYI